MSRQFNLARAGLPFLVLAAAGCGRGGPVPVKGVVTLDGRPFASAAVQFLAQDPGGRDALGSTDASGVFRLSTFHPGDGALPGKYKVVVQPPSGAVSGPPAATPTAAQTGSGGRRPTGTSPTVPARYSQPDQTVLVQEVPAKGDVVLALESK